MLNIPVADALRTVQSLERALDLMEHLAAAEDGLALHVLADRAGLKTPTVHNLLRTLAHRGYVVKLPAPVRYATGPAVQDLARRASRDRLLAAAEPELRTLAVAFPQARVTLATLVANDPVMRLRIVPGRPDVVERPAGGALPPYASASAIAFQAFGDPEAVGEFRRRHPFWEQGAGLWQSPEKLEHALAGFRRAGAVNLKLRGEDLRKLAAPVRGADGYCLGALGLALPHDDVSADQAILRRLRAAADRLAPAGAAANWSKESKNP